MPTYCYKCEGCGREFEAFHHIDERNEEVCCGQGATIQIPLQICKPIIKEYFSENLNCQITGPRQKQRLLKEKNLAEVD